MAEQLDWNTLARELMQVLSTGEALRPDQPYTSRDPGTKYRSGEVTSDVGLLDPVDLLAGMLASKGASLVGKADQGVRFSPEAESLFAQIDTILKRVRASQPVPLPRDFAREAAEKIGAKRAAHEAEDAALLTRRQPEIEAALKERLTQYRDLDEQSRAYRAQFHPAEPAPEAQRILRDLATGKDIAQPGKPPEPGRAQDYAEIIRKLFEREGQ